MKKQLTLLTTPLILLATAGTAVADMGLDCLSPYVGVDAQVRHMGFQKRFGGKVLKESTPQGNFFAGLKFNDCVGIEAGYEVAKKKSKSTNLRGTDTLFGIPLVSAPSVSYKNSANSKIHGWNLNLVGYLPVGCEDNCLSLIGSVGVAQLKLTAHQTLTITAPGEPTAQSSVHFDKRKAVLRLAGGAQYMITDCIGLRGLVTWENTSKLKVHTVSSSGARYLAKPKNTFNYGIGIFTQF